MLCTGASILGENEASSEPRTERSGVSGRPKNSLVPLRSVRDSETFASFHRHTL